MKPLAFFLNRYSALHFMYMHRICPNSLHHFKFYALLQVADYMLARNETLCVSGSLPHLGAWQVDQMLPLTGVCFLCLFAFSCLVQKERWWLQVLSKGFKEIETSCALLRKLKPVSPTDAAAGPPAALFYPCTVEMEGMCIMSKLFSAEGHLRRFPLHPLWVAMEHLTPKH